MLPACPIATAAEAKPPAAATTCAPSALTWRESLP
jgi:hypothetical protein